MHSHTYTHRKTKKHLELIIESESELDFPLRLPREAAASMIRQGKALIMILI